MKNNLPLKQAFSLKEKMYGNKILLTLLLLVFFNTHKGFGQSGAALDFDGANDYVTCGNIMPATYTKEAWFLVSNLSINNNLISGGGDGQHALYPGSVNGNRLSAGHNGTWNSVQDATPIVANTWYHVALTYDAATTTMKLYKNGVLVSTNNTVPAFIGGNALRIGAFDNTQNLLGGKIDEVRIWNRVLPQCEIQNNMNGELPTGQVGLVAYYKFNQGVAAANNTGITTLTDSSGNGNNGTLTNFALTGSTSNWITPGGVTTGTMSPAPLSVTSPQVFCGASTVANLTATGTNINWYNLATGGTALASTTALATGTYYVSQTIGTCESPRTAVTVTVNNTAAPTATSPQSFNTGAKVSNLTATGTALNWYSVPTAGTALATTTDLSTASYYVSQTLNSCESTRTTVQVNIKGAALNFDGVNDYISCGNILPPTYTKEAWFYISNLSLNNNLISGGTDGQHALYAGAVYGNKLSAGHNGTWNQVQDPTPVVANTWYHVALTYDAATTTMKLYTNGVLVSTNTNVLPIAGGNGVRIGAFGDTQNLLGGKIDEVRIWSRALSQSEIQNNKNCELGAGQTNLLAYYQFNQGVDNATNSAITMLTDASGNAYNGTLNNFALTGTSSNFVGVGGVSTGVICSNYTLDAASFDTASSFNVYPNPSSDVFFIESNTNGTAVVTDLLGKTIQSQKITTGTTKLNLSQAQTGVYLLKITNVSNESKTLKLVKK